MRNTARFGRRRLLAVALVGGAVRVDCAEEDKVNRSTGVMFFFKLADSGSAEKLPLVTIPAQ